MRTIRSTLVAAALAAGTVLSTGGTAAAETRIDCPLTTASRTITSPLPAGWWTTPVTEPLSRASVEAIGGLPTLVCAYGPAGQVMMRAPEGQPCRADGRGFVCGARSFTGRLHSTGAFLVQQTFFMDLDVGAQPRLERDGDVWFEAANPREMFLTPRNGSLLALGDGSDRGFAGCRGAAFSGDRIPLASVRPGTYVRAITGDGRLSQFKVDAISPSSPRSLTILYTTWN